MPSAKEHVRGVPLGDIVYEDDRVIVQALKNSEDGLYVENADGRGVGVKVFHLEAALDASPGTTDEHLSAALEVTREEDSVVLQSKKGVSLSLDENTVQSIVDGA